MRKLFLILLGVFLILTTSAHATLPTLEELTQSVQTQINKIETFQAQVTTTMKSPLINDGKPSIQISKVYKKGSDKIRTETITPDAQVLVENGAWLYTQNPATGQVIKSQRSVKTERMDGLSQVGQINDYLKDYDLQVKDYDAQTFILEGKPRVPNKYIESMKIYFDKTNKQLRQVQVFNKSQQNIFDLSLVYQVINNIPTPIKTSAKVDMGFASMSIVVDYQNVKINEPLSDGLFEL